MVKPLERTCHRSHLEDLCAMVEPRSCSWAKTVEPSLHLLCERSSTSPAPEASPPNTHKLSPDPWLHCYFALLLAWWHHRCAAHLHAGSSSALRSKWPFHHFTTYVYFYFINATLPKCSSQQGNWSPLHFTSECSTVLSSFISIQRRGTASQQDFTRFQNRQESFPHARLCTSLQ